METMQLAVLILMAFNVVMWKLVYQEHEQKSVRLFRKNQRRIHEFVCEFEMREFNRMIAIKTARITHKKLVLA